MQKCVYLYWILCNHNKHTSGFWFGGLFNSQICTHSLRWRTRATRSSNFLGAAIPCLLLSVNQRRRSIQQRGRFKAVVLLCLAYQASINPYQYYHFFICLWTCYNCELWPIYCFRCQNTTVAKFASYSLLSTWDRTFTVALIASRANYRTSMFKLPQRAKTFVPPCLLRTW